MRDDVTTIALEIVLKLLLLAKPESETNGERIFVHEDLVYTQFLSEYTYTEIKDALRYIYNSTMFGVCLYTNGTIGYYPINYIQGMNS